MKKPTENLLQLFKGKVCTVFTVPTNRDFEKESQESYLQAIYNYFLGRVQKVDEDGVLLEQLGEDPPLLSYFFREQIVGIVQEKEYDPNDPKDAEIVKNMQEVAKEQVELAKQQPAMPTSQPASETPYINPEVLDEMVKNLSQQHGVPVSK